LLVLPATLLVLEGPIWQIWPAAPLILLLILAAWRGWRLSGWRLWGWLGRAFVVLLLLLAIGPWMVAPPVPTLAKPSGPYALGSRTFRWVDASRPETLTADPADRRNVIAQAWYLASPGSVGQTSTYMDGLGRLPPTISELPRFMMRRYGHIDTHAIEGAPVSPQKSWPVVLFSPGYGAPRFGYTGLLTELASRGFVVVALDHPYESAVTQLADGRIAANIAPHGNLGAYMASQQDIRAADLSFVLDRLAAGALPDLDLTRVYAIGHSFGGPSAVLAMTRDPRIRAAANLDGTPYGSLPEQKLDHPYLLIESDYAETPHGDNYLAGNASLLANDSAPTRRLTLVHANHYSFTDMPLLFNPPGRWALTLVMGGERGPVATQRQTADELTKFLGSATPP